LPIFAMSASIASPRLRFADESPTAAGHEAAIEAPEPEDPRGFWLQAFCAVREETERRAAFLSPEDQVVQSMPDASPTKWHRAHVTWFFEQFLLRPHAKDYRPYDERFSYLYNSYYVSVGPRQARPQRGLITRPSAGEVTAYRRHVDAAVVRLIDSVAQSANQFGKLASTIEIGLHHEQQHQELLITDILHAFSLNETHPAYDPQWRWPQPSLLAPAASQFGKSLGGVHTIGHGGTGHGGKGFCFDNEQPAHQVMLQPVRLATSLVTNGEWLEFMADGGYATPTLWLSDGWAALEAQAWQAPGYWHKRDGAWFAMTLGGLQPIDPAQPVCHVSYYEADAFARWAGKHLPSEAEWEVAAQNDLLADAFGIVWQWTRSAYAPYPGYRAAAGALGEYNGKFMVNQMVLRGSSLATPAGHARATYRNFFYPSARWQFSGLRLADYHD
jgi:ergothioneine biosynthesis protein EgtB